MAPPVTNPHSADIYWTCEACYPPVTIYASSQKELDKLVAAHNAEFHPGLT